MADKFPLTVNPTSKKLEELQPNDMLSSPDGVKSDLGFLGQQVLLQRSNPPHPAYPGAADEVGITLKRDALRSNNHGGIALKSNASNDYSFQSISSADTFLGHLIRFFIDDILVAIPNNLLTNALAARDIYLDGNPNYAGKHSLGGDSTVNINMKTAKSNADHNTFRIRVSPNPLDSNNAVFAIEAMDDSGRNGNSMLEFYHDGRILMPPPARGGGFLNARQFYTYKGIIMVTDDGTYSGTGPGTGAQFWPTLQMMHRTNGNVNARNFSIGNKIDPQGNGRIEFVAQDDALQQGSDRGLLAIEHGGILKATLGMMIGWGFDDPPQGMFRLQVNSQIWALNAAIATPSDRRLKSNIKPVADGALNVVNNLQPCTFDKKVGEEHEFQVGFIAQEAADALAGQAYKDCVVHTPAMKDEMYTMAPSSLIPVMVKAIQELTAEVKALRAEVDELKRMPK